MLCMCRQLSCRSPRPAEQERGSRVHDTCPPPREVLSAAAAWCSVERFSAREACFLIVYFSFAVSIMSVLNPEGGWKDDAPGNAELVKLFESTSKAIGKGKKEVIFLSYPQVKSVARAIIHEFHIVGGLRNLTGDMLANAALILESRGYSDVEDSYGVLKDPSVYNF